MATSVPNKVVQTKYFDYGKEFNTHSRPQFLVEAGFGHNTSETADCTKDGHSNL